MPTLLIRLCGPMQSWGTRSRWSERDTELEPSLSGVVGMLCAAKGVSRVEPIPGQWMRLRMGVRVDREGIMSRDYHTAGGAYETGIARADGGRLHNAVLSNRYYLADADFLVGLEHQDEAVLREIENALREPTWQLFLGRKSFLPAVPVYFPSSLGSGIRRQDLERALEVEQPWEPTVYGRRSSAPDGRTRIVIQCAAGETASEVRVDQPRPGSFASRRFATRYVRTTFIDIPRGETDG